MQIKTEGIVLHSLKYSDSATIVTVYTVQFGRVSYMVHGVNKKKSKFRAAFLQPLTLVEMDVFHVPGKEIQTIKDIRIAFPFTGIPFHPVKNALALFISEVLFRSLKRAEEDDNLFQFLSNSIRMLDYCEEGLANFHLVFLMKLTRYLGFEPYGEEFVNSVFDLVNGVFTTQRPMHSHYLKPDVTLHFYQTLQADYMNMHSISLSRQERQQLLEVLVEYYRLHVPDFHGLKSLTVLSALFD